MDINKDEILESKFFCVAPWIHLNIWPSGDVHACCMSNDIYGSVYKSSLKEIWNSDELKKMRLDMLNNIRRPGCSPCHIDERSVPDRFKEFHHISRRQAFNTQIERYFDLIEKTNPDGSLDKFNPFDWDLRFSNKCNFSCRMCGPEFSSTWEKELNQTRKKSIDFSKVIGELEESFHLVDEVYFAGGEPLIMDEHYQILDKLIELKRTDIKLSYSTNFSTLKYKDKNILDYWKKFTNLFIYASVDGSGRRGEIIRKGFNWEKFARNSKIIHQHIPNANYDVSCTLQALNSFHIVDLHRTLYEDGIIKNINNFHINFLKYPEYYAVQSLPKELKKDLINKIKNYIETYLKPNKAFKSIVEYVSLIKFIISSESDKKTFMNFVLNVKNLDLTRNENCREAFPEFEKHIWKYYY